MLLLLRGLCRFGMFDKLPDAPTFDIGGYYFIVQFIKGRRLQFDIFRFFSFERNKNAGVLLIHEIFPFH